MGTQENKGTFPGTDNAVIELSEETKEGKVSFEVDIMEGPPAGGRPLYKCHAGCHRKKTPPLPRILNEEVCRPNPAAEGDSKCCHSSRYQEPRQKHPYRTKTSPGK